MKRQTYFLHIPKTAGTSFRRVLECRFPASEWCPVTALPELIAAVRRDPGELTRYPLIAGHLGYHVVPYLKGRPVIMTMLREPVARTVSTVNYISREAGHWIHQLTDRFRTPVVDIEAFLDFEPARHLVTNFQTRTIALDCDLEARYTDGEGRAVVPGMGRLLAEFCVSDRLDPALLETAKQRLERFEFVGITERFADSIKLLQTRFGWNVDTVAPRSNTAPERALSADDLDTGVRERIEQYLSLDVALYRFATSLFDARMQSTDATAGS